MTHCFHFFFKFLPTHRMKTSILLALSIFVCGVYGTAQDEHERVYAPQQLQRAIDSVKAGHFTIFQAAARYIL